MDHGPLAPVSAVSATATRGLRPEHHVARHAARAVFWISAVTGCLLALTLPLWWLALGLCFEGDACRAGHLRALCDDVLGLFCCAGGLLAGRAWLARLDAIPRTLDELEAEFLDGAP